MLKTTAFDKAEQLGWSIPELARRTGLSKEVLYKMKQRRRSPGPKAIEAMLRAFPNLGYRDLFLPDDRPLLREKSAAQRTETAA